MSTHGDIRAKQESEDISADRLGELHSLLIGWEQDNYVDFPWRSTKSRLHALIVEVMLQRTRAEQVLPVYQSFIEKVPDLKTPIEAGEIRQILWSLGLNWRIEKIIELLSFLQEKNEISNNYNELIQLPGVGDYVASAFLSLHLDIWSPLIDSNSIRLWGRVLGIETGPETRRKSSFRYLVSKITPVTKFQIFNYAVLDLSRAVCRPKPLCNKCPLSHLCIYYKVISNGEKKKKESNI